MKTKLIELATSKQIGFTSQMFTDTNWKHSLKEDLRYYLWMCELQKWCREEYDMLVLIESDMLTYDVSIYGKYALQEIRLSSYLSDPQTYLFTTYEQALEEGLYQTLLLIQEKNEKGN
jgi:hypothetical protein